MPIFSQQFPTLMKATAQMNAAANGATELAMASVKSEAEKSFHKRFFRQGGKLSSLSFTDQDYEPGGHMANWPEGRPISEQTFYEGYSLKGTSQHFGGKFLYSLITHRAGKTALLKSGPRMLGESEAKTREELCHAMIIYGATALASIPKVNGIAMVNPTCGDNVILFSASHRWRHNNSITNSNLVSSTYYHPTQTGVNVVNKQIGRWRDINGDAMMVRVRQLLIPIELELLCSVFKASGQNPLDGTNAENMFNTLVPDGYIADPHLPSTSDWYFLTNRPDQRPQIRELIAPWIIPLEFEKSTMSSGVQMITSYAIAPSVHGWMSIGKVTGTPGDITNDLKA